MAPSKESKKKNGKLHRAIQETDMRKTWSLWQQLPPSLCPAEIFATMSCYEGIRSHPEGKNATPLIVAIHLGALKICEHLIEEGADVNWGSLDGMTPLFLALNHKHFKIAELLVESGANVHAPDRDGRAPIHHAIDKDSPVSTVKAILAAGFPKESIIFDNGLIKSKPLTRAISVKNVPVVKFLLEQNVDVNSPISEGTTPLIVAISQSSPEIVKLLIDHGANIEGRSMNDAPPLFLAMQTEDTTMLQILIDAGVDVNRLFTPLQYVLNIFRIPYITALQLAAVVCNLPATKLLLEHGADVNAKNPMMNGNALHMLFAAEPPSLNEKQKKDHQKIIHYLLENGADITVKDIGGKKPIQNALISKNWIALEEYIKFGANLNEPVNKKDGSILRFVVANKKVALVKLCLAFGADCFQKFHGVPVYKDLIRSDSADILRLFWKYNYPFDETLQGKSVANNPRVLSLLSSQRLFMESITKNDPEILKRALNLGAEVNCRFKDGSLPLHICSARGYAELVKILLEHKATVQVTSLSKTGYTALHEAARAGHLEICKMLMRHGACLNYKGPGGATPCQLAKRAGHKKVVSLFKTAARFFSVLRKDKAMIMHNIKTLGSEEISVFINCINRHGRTLVGEAIRLDLQSIGGNLMSLRREV